AVRTSVVHLVGESVGSVVVGVRRVGERAVRAEHQGAVRRGRDEDRDEGVAVDVGVVRKYPGHGDRQGRVLVAHVVVIQGHGRVVDRVDGDADGRLVRLGAGTVAGRDLRDGGTVLGRDLLGRKRRGAGTVVGRDLLGRDL